MPTAMLAYAFGGQPQREADIIVTPFKPKDVDDIVSHRSRLITCSLTGHSARVVELFTDGAQVPMTLTGNHRYEVSGPTPHQIREHHRGELLGIIKMELEHGAVAAIGRPGVTLMDTFIRGNMEATLWPDDTPPPSTTT